MLLELAVRDFALVSSLRLRFEAGFTVVTGETGAGKSLLMSALGVALGGRAEEEMVRQGAKEARIEARFDLAGSGLPAAEFAAAGIDHPADGELLVVREILPGGKSRARVNDAAVTQAGLRRLGSRLVDLHGQHEHQWLLDPARQLMAVDRYAGLLADREALRAAHDAHRASLQELLDLEDALRRAREEEELRRFQRGELRAARLAEGEEESLLAERERLRHAEAFRSSLAEAEEALYAGDGSAEDRLGAARRALDRVASLDGEVAAANEELLAAAHVVGDVAGVLRRAREALDADPGRLDAIEARLETLGELRRKYGAADTGELLARLAALDRELERAAGAGEHRRAARERVAECAREFHARCARMSARRRDAASALAREVMREIAEMSMARAVFRVAVTAAPALAAPPADPLDPLDGLGPEGGDTVEFMLAANPGESSLPLRRVASGGELSRVMLALKHILAGADEVDTLVFDEIDLGIGGDAARAVGEKMRAIGDARQVLCITHLATLAAMGTRHLHVEKKTSEGRTHVLARELDGEERVRELARMLAGSEPSEVALRHGRELLAAGGARPGPAAGEPRARRAPGGGNRVKL